MAETADRRLTKLSFRRDVKIFLTALGCFFTLLVAVLLLLVHQTMREARTARDRQWNSVADTAAEDIAASLAAGQTSNVGIILTAIRARHPITAAEAVLASGPRFLSGASGDDGSVIERREAWGTLRLTFDDSALVALDRNIRLITGITATATAGGLILLLLYIPRIVRPIEALLDQAAQIEERPASVDEQSYLLDTFRKTVDTLKRQQDELRVLHDQEKNRADELARMTAALTRGMTSGLLAIDPSGTLVEVNQAGRDILRIPAMSEDRRSIESVLGATPFASLVRDALERRAPLTRRETTVTTGEGEVLSIGVTSVPLRNDSDAFFGMLVLFTDLTAIRQLETRLRDSQILAELGEMSAGIAHEFRNSLSTILGYLKLAQRSGTADGAVERVRKAEEEASQLSAAVESLLAFAKPVVLQPQEVRLRSLIEDVIDRLEPASDSVQFTVHGDLAVEGDPALLTRAFQNIVLNAVEAIHAKGAAGRVDIRLDSERRTVDVSDDGIGLDPAQAPRLLLPFHSGKPQGFGLGLPLAKKIAVLHGGMIQVTGAPGAGATVTLDFGVPPRASAES